MLAQFLILTVLASVAPQIVPGVKVKGIESAALLTVVFVLLNMVLGPFLKWTLAALSLPFVILTLGLFMFVVTVTVNTLLLKLTDALLDSFEIKGWGPAFLMGLLFTFGGYVAGWIF